MKPGMILLTVIIPTYNYIDGLDRCINSVISQLTDNCECVIVDDGSEEDFIKKLRKYDGLMPNLHIEYCTHKGAGAARNKGISLAKGKYICFLDADDEMEPGFISYASDLIQLEDDTDLCIFGITAHNVDTDTRDMWVPGEYKFLSASDFADEYIRNRHLLVYSQCNKLYKLEIIKNYQISFNEKLTFGEDRLFNYDYIRRCGKIVTSNRPMFIYHMRSRESQSTEYKPGFPAEILELHEKKMECFLNLSKGTTKVEKSDFKCYDLCREIEKMIDIFKINPRKAEKDIDFLNSYILKLHKSCGHPDSYFQSVSEREPHGWFLDKQKSQKILNEIKSFDLSN